MKLDNPPTPKILKKLANASKGLTTYQKLMQICGYLEDNETIVTNFRTSKWTDYTRNKLLN